MNVKEFQKKINHVFINSSYLETALTHSSYIQDRNLPRSQCNERLEYLGDALLDAIIGEELFYRRPEESEGVLSKLRAAIVCEKSLSSIGEELSLGRLLRMGKGEERGGGRRRESVIADAVEAVIGAVFLDSGYDNTRMVVLQLFEDTIEDALDGRLYSDYKSELQERVQARGNNTIEYKLEGEDGPPHDKTFYTTLFISGVACGRGVGKTKKEAEQAAAREACQRGLDNVF